MLVSISDGFCLDGLVGAILLRAAMVGVVRCREVAKRSRFVGASLSESSMLAGLRAAAQHLHNIISTLMLKV